MKDLEAKGHLFCVGSDNNETDREGRYPEGDPMPHSMAELFDSCQLVDILATHNTSVPTTSTKTQDRYIDKLMLSSGLTATASGMGSILSIKESDHRPLYCDLNSDFIGGKSSPMEPMSARRLSVGNDLIVKSYMDYINAQIHYHNMEARIDTLMARFFDNKRVFTPSMMKTLVNLDDQRVEFSKAASNQCSNIGKYENAWSPEYQRAGQMVSYWKYRLCDPTYAGDDISRKMGRKAGLDLWEMERCILPTECKQHLTEAVEWFTCLKRDAIHHRVLFQEAQADRASAGDDKAKERIIRKIKESENSKRAFRRIATALGKSKGGLTKLIAPNKDGTETTLLDMESIHPILLKRNYKHYGQANETDFGANGGSAHLIDPEFPR